MSAEPADLTRDEQREYQADLSASVLTDANREAFEAKWGPRLAEPGPPPEAVPDARVPLVPSVPEPTPGPDAGDEGDAAAPTSPQPRSLARIAADEAELFHDAGGTAFARIVAGNHRETWPVGSRAFKEWLSSRYFAGTGTAPKTAALTEGLLEISGRARFAGPRRDVHLRVARDGGAVLVDLADDEWRAAEVTPAGWRLVHEPPVIFRRTRSMASLPEPVAGARVEELRQYLNVTDDGGWRLLVAWLLFALAPEGPFPVLILHGEQGSAKSTAARLLRALVDPATGSGLRAEPKDVEDLAVATANSWVLAFDNLSSLKSWLSDALCRVATGGGLAKRELYSDSEEIVLDARRPVILNGINELATRGDLLDRSILVNLDPIPEENRLSEAELWEGFGVVRPRVVGALFDALAGTLLRLPDITLARRPRMADFALFGTAAEAALGWPEGSFLAAYEANRQDANDLALDAAPIGPVVRDLIDKHGKWTGTAEDLRRELGQFADLNLAKSEWWPKNAWAMSNRLDRIAPNLRAAGVGVFRYRKAHGNRERMIVLWLIADHGSSPPREALASEEGE